MPPRNNRGNNQPMGASKSAQKQKGHPQTQQQVQHTTWVKHHKKRNAAITATIVSILVIVIVIASLPSPNVKAGQQAPDFALQDVNTGTNFHLRNELGKPVMVEFMRTTCEWCQKEAPLLSQVFQNYTSVVFVSVSIDPNTDQPSVLQYFASQHSSTGSSSHPWYWLRDDIGNPVNTQYGVAGTPTMFMIDTHGMVRDRLGGYTDLPALQQAFQTIV